LSSGGRPRAEGSSIAFPDRILDYSRRSDGVFVLPDSDDLPTSFAEAAICFGIASLVSLNLGDPEVGVLLRWPVVLRTAMPETPVEEDSDFGPGEDDIGSATNLGNGTQADSVPQAKRVHGGAER
jgi:hypothetical protein